MNKSQKFQNKRNNKKVKREYDITKYTWQNTERRIKGEIDNFIKFNNSTNIKADIKNRIIITFTDCYKDKNACIKRYEELKRNHEQNKEIDSFNCYGKKVFINNTEKFSKIHVKFYTRAKIAVEYSNVKRRITRLKKNKSTLNLEYLEQYKKFLGFCKEYLALYLDSLFPKSLVEDCEKMFEEFGFSEYRLPFIDWLKDFGLNDEKFAVNYLSLMGAFLDRNELIELFLSFMSQLLVDNNKIILSDFDDLREELLKAYFSNNIVLKNELKDISFIEYKLNETRTLLNKKIYNDKLELYVNEKPNLTFQIISSTNNHITKHHRISNKKVKLAVKLEHKYRILDYKCYYCKDCDIYFDFNNAFEIQIEKIGLKRSDILVNYIDESKKSNNYNNFQKESLLHFLGYHVGKNGLYKLTRQELLTNIINRKIMTVSEIMEILNQNINMFERRAEMKDAIKDWKEDIYFVKNDI